jgi:Holliday junction resolvase RusA-like endonuclease
MSNPSEPLPSRGAIHEAGHAAVAAVMGMPDIWITVVSKRLQCECRSTTPNTYAALAVSFGGYVADININSLPESDCLQRSMTDTKHREQIIKSHAPMYGTDVDWSNVLANAKKSAVSVAEARAEDIIQVAREIDKYIAKKIDVPREIVEQWQGIQDARAFGEAMRQQQPDVPTSSQTGLMLVDSEQKRYEPTGIISFRVNLAPTSQQSKRAVKDGFTKACKEAMAKFPVILYGEVKVDIVWYIHEQDRYETDAAPDVDNILKPLLDGLYGPGALLIDDCQVQEISCRWIDSAIHDQSVEIEVRHHPDDWLRRDSLSFVEFESCLCMPLSDSAPREAKILMLETWRLAFATREALLQKGWDWYSANSVMPIIRPFHKSRVIKRFKVISIDAMMRDLASRF